MNYKNENSKSWNAQHAVDQSNISYKTMTKQEKQYIQNSQVFDELCQLNHFYEEKNEIEIFKTISNLINLLNKQKKDILPQLIPENEIILLIKIFVEIREVSIIRSMLKLFDILIALSDDSNDNMNAMIQNSFLDVIISFPNEIHNMNRQSKIIISYFNVIKSLISFCIDNTNSNTGKIIIQLINLDFIINLFDFIRIGKGTKHERIQWLDCIQKYFQYCQNTYISTTPDLFPKFLNLFKTLLSEEYDSYYYYSKIIITLTMLINSYLIEQISWDMFILLDFPQILSEFSSLEDYVLVTAASDCIVACSCHGFNDFNFNIDDVFKLAIEFEIPEMYKSLFCAYSLIASNNILLIDAFFTSKLISFLCDISNFGFTYKKEIAIFIAQMIEFAQTKHISFIVKSPEILTFLYQIYADSNDNEILSVILSSFSKIGSKFTTSYTIDKLNQFFRGIIPQDFIDNLNQIDDEDNFMYYQLVLNEYPFFFGI